MTSRAAVRHEAGECGCSAPDSNAAERCYCTVEDLVRAISRKHSLSILNFIGSEGVVRFTDLEEALPAISTSTLSETLRVLRDVGLVAREVFPETPPRVEYGLTDAGRLLRDRFHDLLDRVRDTG